MDFTLSIYTRFLNTLLKNGYTFITFKEYIKNKICFENKSVIILRHDVDHLPKNSLKTAEIENSLGIKGTYYFRIIPSIYKKKIVEKLAASGHEIGYQYEDVDLVRKNKLHHSSLFSLIKQEKAVQDKELLLKLSYESFCKNIDYMRETFSIETICAHGSPLSPYDNKIIWNSYDYKELGIIGDPAFDIDWHNFAYFTDTGRRWNGTNVNVRDKVESKYNFNFDSTNNIIRNIEKLPSRIMFTVHTHRWFKPGIMWMQELNFSKYEKRCQILHCQKK